MIHDLAYSRYKDLKQRHRADSQLIEEANKRILAKDSSLSEKLAAATVSSLISGKKYFGMGYKRSEGKQKNKRKIKVVKRQGGSLFPILSRVKTAASLIGNPINVYKNVQQIKQNKKLINEIQKQNKVIERLVKGQGLYLKPYKKGKGYKKTKNKKKS